MDAAAQPQVGEGAAVTAQYVTVILDLVNGDGSLVTEGSMTWAPSQLFPDMADAMTVGQGPLTRKFGPAGHPSVKVLACDTAGPQGASLPGWTWNVSYSGVPGSPPDASYFVLASNGLTQRLSSLASVPAAQPGQQYLPLQGGTLLGGVAPSVIPLADASTVTPNAVLGNDFRLVMTSAVGGSRTIAAAVPVSDGQTMRITLVQPASGGPCSVLWAAAYNFGRNASAPALGTAAGNRDLLAFDWEATDQEWLYLGSQGY